MVYVGNALHRLEGMFTMTSEDIEYYETIQEQTVKCHKIRKFRKENSSKDVKVQRNNQNRRNNDFDYRDPGFYSWG